MSRAACAAVALTAAAAGPAAAAPASGEGREIQLPVRSASHGEGS